MSLNTLVDYISNSQITSELIKRISKNKELNIVGSSRYAKSIIIDSIAKKEKKNILLICPNVEIAYKWIGYFESINDKAVYIILQQNIYHTHQLINPKRLNLVSLLFYPN